MSAYSTSLAPQWPKIDQFHPRQIYELFKSFTFGFVCFSCCCSSGTHISGVIYYPLKDWHLIFLFMCITVFPMKRMKEWIWRISRSKHSFACLLSCGFAACASFHLWIYLWFLSFLALCSLCNELAVFSRSVLELIFNQSTFYPRVASSTDCVRF